MDVNRRHFIGAAGAAGALVLPPNLARAKSSMSSINLAIRLPLVTMRVAVS